eukprot:6010229-Amphidinium_carterae.1
MSRAWPNCGRSSTTVKIGWRFWLSQQLVVKVAEIVMREMLGYKVVLPAAVFPTWQYYYDMEEVFD